MFFLCIHRENSRNFKSQLELYLACSMIHLALVINQLCLKFQTILTPKPQLIDSSVNRAQQDPGITILILLNCQSIDPRYNSLTGLPFLSICNFVTLLIDYSPYDSRFCYLLDLIPPVYFPLSSGTSSLISIRACQGYYWIDRVSLLCLANYLKTGRLLVRLFDYHAIGSFLLEGFLLLVIEFIHIYPRIFDYLIII